MQNHDCLIFNPFLHHDCFVSVPWEDVAAVPDIDKVSGSHWKEILYKYIFIHIMSKCICLALFLRHKPDLGRNS